MSFREIQNEINRLHVSASDLLDRINQLLALKNDVMSNPTGPKGNRFDAELIREINAAIIDAERECDHVDNEIDRLLRMQAHMNVPACA